MRKFHTLLLLFATVTGGFAQELVSEGYIVKTAGDTVRGFIREGSDTELSARVSFKENMEGAYAEYNSSSISAFGFTYGRVFRLFASPLKANPDEKNLFGKRLLSGKIELFSTRNSLFIFTKGDSSWIVRTPKKRRYSRPAGPSDRGDRGEYLASDLNHIKVIVPLMSDSKIPMADLEIVSYGQSSLTRITNRYNNEFASVKPAVVYKERKKVNYRVSYGLGLTGPSGQKSYLISGLAELTRLEKSRNVTYMAGLTYSGFERPVDGSKNGITTTKENRLSIYVAAINFQTRANRLQPYLHFDLGALSFVNSTVTNVSTGLLSGATTLTSSEVSETSFFFVNISAGVKMNLGKIALLLEANKPFHRNAANPEAIYASLGVVF